MHRGLAQGSYAATVSGKTWTHTLQVTRWALKPIAYCVNTQCYFLIPDVTPNVSVWEDSSILISNIIWHLLSVNHFVDLSQPSEAWHFLSRCRTMEVNNCVFVHDQKLERAYHITKCMYNIVLSDSYLHVFHTTTLNIRVGFVEFWSGWKLNLERDTRWRHQMCPQF